MHPIDTLANLADPAAIARVEAEAATIVSEAHPDHRHPFAWASTLAEQLEAAIYAARATEATREFAAYGDLAQTGCAQREGEEAAVARLLGAAA
jgi:hypothetical protein